MSDKKKVSFRFLTIPLLFVALCWLIHFIESTYHPGLTKLGIFPRTLHGLKGILFSPLLHGSWEHLVNNTFSFLVLSGLLFNLYGKPAIRIFIFSWFLSGIWLWSLGRPSYHIGASGLIYALASFHFFSGIIRWNPRLVVISLLVVFLYGYLIWGILPIEEGVSFEGHLAGGLAGLVIAFVYRKEGPQSKKYHWEEEEHDEEEYPYWIVDPETDEIHPTNKKVKKKGNLRIVYDYRKKDKEDKESE